MKCFALIGVVLFIGVAVAPSINADVKEPDVGTISIDTIDEIELQQQKLLKLAESYISYYERTNGPLPDEDCGCELEETSLWPFPVICIVLFVLNWPFFILFFLSKFTFQWFPFGYIAQDIGCWWAGPPYPLVD